MGTFFPKKFDPKCFLSDFERKFTLERPLWNQFLKKLVLKYFLCAFEQILAFWTLMGRTERHRRIRNLGTTKDNFKFCRFITNVVQAYCQNLFLSRVKFFLSNLFLCFIFLSKFVPSVEICLCHSVCLSYVVF